MVHILWWPILLIAVLWLLFVLSFLFLSFSLNLSRVTPCISFLFVQTKACLNFEFHMLSLVIIKGPMPILFQVQNFLFDLHFQLLSRWAGIFLTLPCSRRQMLPLKGFRPLHILPPLLFTWSNKKMIDNIFSFTLITINCPLRRSI